MKCCGVTGNFDWDEWSKIDQGQLPVSCCPNLDFGGGKQCSVDFAFQTDCMSVFKEECGKECLTIGAVGLVASLVNFVIMTFIYFMDKDTFSKVPPAVNPVG